MRDAITITPRKIKEGSHSGNIASPYGSNSLYFTKNGEPWAPLCGGFHFSRCEPGEWRRELLKMQAGGLNMVSTYIFWNHHEYADSVFDFSGCRDIGRFLGICREVGMPAILRIGPWAHGECVWGGFPPEKRKASAGFTMKSASRMGRCPSALNRWKRWISGPLKGKHLPIHMELKGFQSFMI